MIIKNEERSAETKDNMRGGPGTVTLKEYFPKTAFGAKCRLCTELIIPPGAGVGKHDHIGEDEIYIIQKGCGIMDDNGSSVEIKAGDAVLTGKGASHSVTNTGTEDLVITAVIMQY